MRHEISRAKTEILGGLRILVVDDDSDGREVLAVQLAQQGATTSVSPSADDALRRMDTFRPDVIVADIGMPGEDGYSLIRKIRNSSRDRSRLTPAIALDAGYQKHISKPVEPEELVLTIASLAGHP